MTLEIAEGIAGTFHYHLRADGKFQSLCARPVMQTKVPLSAWGVTTHLNERWCAECAKHLPATDLETQKT